ncbi:MAG: GNAT family N-acetyltransferase [Bacteroidota bacterium]
MIDVREWSQEDFPVVRRILWTTWVATYGSFVPEHDLRWYLDTHYSTPALTDLLARPDVRGYLGEIDGRPAGWMRTTMNQDERRLFVSSLYVLPGEQGRGIGSRLLREAERSAREQSATELWLGVMEQNVGAISWYRKKGFQFIREEPFAMGGSSLNHLIGFKSLSATE